jgi:hypothetical protein
MNADCLSCGEPMTAGDSGEPDLIPGWWCDNCKEFISDEEYAESWDEDEEPPTYPPEHPGHKRLLDAIMNEPDE